MARSRFVTGAATLLTSAMLLAGGVLGIRSITGSDSPETPDATAPEAAGSASGTGASGIGGSADPTTAVVGADGSVTTTLGGSTPATAAAATTSTLASTTTTAPDPRIATLMAHYDPYDRVDVTNIDRIIQLDQHAIIFTIDSGKVDPILAAFQSSVDKINAEAEVARSGTTKTMLYSLSDPIVIKTDSGQTIIAIISNQDDTEVKTPREDGLTKRILDEVVTKLLDGTFNGIQSGVAGTLPDLSPGDYSKIADDADAEVKTWENYARGVTLTTAPEQGVGASTTRG
jgi:hypothetical protein